MSRSNPTEQQPNPSKFFFEWRGADGGFAYYDKEAKQKVNVDYPFDFLVLDTLVTLKGYNEPEKKGYWSNEVKSADINKSTFTVRSKAGVEFSGSYKECKEKLGTKGLDYVASVYIAYKHNGELVIANLQLKGAAVGPWIDFCKANKIYECAVRVNSHKADKKGAVTFFSPIFTPINKVSEQTQEAAKLLDAQLQDYLTHYFARQNTNTDSHESAAQVVETQQITNAPEQQAHVPASTLPPKQTPTMEAAQEMVDNILSQNDDDDLPF